MSLRRVLHGVVLLGMSAWLAVAAAASEYHGQVVFGGQPLPGSTVTVTATQGDKKAVAISDDQGVFVFPDLADGKWTLTIQMTGFAPLKQEVTIAPNAPVAAFELKLLSLDEIRAESKPVKVDVTQLAAATTGPAAGSPGAGAATPHAGSQEGLLINGSQSNASTSQFSMNQAFGNNRNRRSLYNGSIFINESNAGLNAAPYSLTGTPVPKPQFNNYTTGLNFGGPLNIKHVMPRGPGFYVSYTHSQNSDYETVAALIPTAQERAGMLDAGQPIFVPAQLTQPNVTSAQCVAALASPGTTYTDPATQKQAFTGNVIPAACIAPAATVLLSLYPQTPNITPGPGSIYNYQAPENSSSSGDTVGLSMYKNFGKNSFNGNFNFSNAGTVNPNIFSFVDTGSTLGMNGSINWGRNFTQRVRNTLTYTFSRSRGQTLPFFAYKNNIEGVAGIQGVTSDAQYWGPPGLNFSRIQGLSDGTFSYNRSETNSIRDEVTWNRLGHNFRFGGEFRRMEFNYRTQSNPNGRLNFTGEATQATTGTGSGATVVGGSDFADFLLGLPDTSSIAYGNADKYLRQSAYRLYATDEYHASQITIAPFLVWEYGSPVSEVNGKLVNLDVGQGFGSAVAVTGSNPLLRPDYGRPEPTLSISWRPISGSSLVVRSSYGMANDTSVYQQAALEMSQQAPLSTSANLSTGCPFNLNRPFALSPACTPSGTQTASIPQIFAIDPNFRVGYVQAWNLQLQRDLPFSMQMVVDYDGTKGTHGVQEFLPNTCAPIPGSVPTVCNSNPHGYIFRTSGGNLEREAGWIRLRRRPRNGFEAELTYTFAKSLDNDYSLGAGGSVTNYSAIAQNWQDLRGQRGLSQGDQRHLVHVTASYTTGMGIGGHALLSGWRGAIYKDWSVHADFSAGTGFPETPVYASETVAGAAISGTLRPNLVGSPHANLTPGVFLNAAAFAAPTPGTYGNARRNSIEGPDTFSFSANMLRTFRLHGRYSLEAALTANNVLNHVVYTGYNTSWTAPAASSGGTASTSRNPFGAPLAAGGMRTVTVNLRMRF